MTSSESLDFLVTQQQQQQLLSLWLLLLPYCTDLWGTLDLCSRQCVAFSNEEKYREMWQHGLHLLML